MKENLSLSKSCNSGLPIIRCCCGAQILLVPSIELMSKAIEAHVKEHRNKAMGHKEAEAEADQVRDDLIAKVLMKASRHL